MKVLIGTVEISGVACNLQAGFQRIGVDSETVLAAPHPFQYDGDRKIPKIVRGWQRLNHTLSALRQRRSRAVFLVSVLYRLYSFGVLSWALLRFDACIFLFGRSITNRRMELLLWRWLGKKVIFVYVGSDTRPPYISGVLFPPSCAVDVRRLMRLTRHAKRNVSFQEKYSDFCVNSPFSAQLHSRPFINWFALGIPRPIAERDSFEPPNRTNSVRILHAPSRLEAKGTGLIRRIVAKLSKVGYEIEYVEISNQPNNVVLAELRRCDFIIDQVYSDTPMAAFVAEAAALKKPAVVGGYAATEFSTYVLSEDTPPSLFVHPDHLESAIKKMIVDVEFRLELGRQAFEFVACRWSQEVVAGRYLRLLNGEAPDSWWYDPMDIQYVRGATIPEQHARHLVSTLLAEHGLSSLQISDKPRLESAFREFVKSQQDTSDQLT